ncbi:MAG: hypothetical protein IJJ60_03475, partial [Clostridia bacterium]|nr:hypothetical protein [Clostridia bacterium]
MSTFFALLRLQLLTRYADLKPKNLKAALRDKRGRTVGMMIAILFLVVYLGVILYILETKALDILTPSSGAPNAVDLRNLVVILAVVLATGGTLVMAFFFIMSALYLGRDATFLAALPIKTRTLLSAKLAQVWLSETLIDAVILLPACVLYGARVGAEPLFYVRMVIVWLLIGSSVAGYYNTNFTQASFDNCKGLRELNLGGLINARRAFDFSPNIYLTTLYTKGSGVTGVTFARNGRAVTVQLNAVASLVMRGLGLLT